MAIRDKGHRKVVLILKAFVIAAVLVQPWTDAMVRATPRQAMQEDAQNPPTAIAPARAFVTNYSVELRQPATHLYVPTENVEVTIFTDRPGGGIENDIGLQSHVVPQGTTNISLGRVPAPGVYFTRYTVGTETFVDSFLVLPATNNKFTVELISAPVTSVALSQAGKSAAEKFFRKLTINRFRTAAAAVAPAWFAQNGQNFLVLATKGIVLAYSNIGFIAVIGQEGLARELFALSLDFVAAALSRAADDLKAAGALTAQERDAVKTAISGINGLTQTLLAEKIFQRMVTLGQSATEVMLGQDSDGQMAAKVAGDSTKKYHVFIKLTRP